MRKTYFIIIFILSSFCCFGQDVPNLSINRKATLFLNKHAGIKDYKIGKPDYTYIEMKDSINSFFSGKIDTLSIDKVTIDLKVPILGDTILYSVSNEKRNSEEDNQNCISYAFENLFESNGIKSAPLCCRFTLITDNSSADLLLNKFCDPYTTLETDLPDSLQNKSLIVCYDKNKTLIHMAFYYNDSFYSKNGGGVLHTIYKRFSDIKRHYPGIKYMKVFKIKDQYQQIN